MSSDTWDRICHPSFSRKPPHDQETLRLSSLLNKEHPGRSILCERGMYVERAQFFLFPNGNPSLLSFLPIKLPFIVTGCTTLNIDTSEIICKVSLLY